MKCESTLALKAARKRLYNTESKTFKLQNDETECLLLKNKDVLYKHSENGFKGGEGELHMP